MEPGLYPTRHRKQIAGKDIDGTLLDPEQTLSDGLGTKPLTFTFVPTVRRLPSRFLIVEPSEFTFKPAEEPKRDRCGEIANKSTVDFETLRGRGANQAAAMQDSPSHKVINKQEILQEKERTVSESKEMQKNDVYQAEFVLITDSDGDDESSTRGNKKQPTVIAVITDHRQERVQSLTAPWDSTGRTGPAELTVGIQDAPKAQHSERCQQNQPQEYKIKSRYKALAAIPTNTLLLEQKALDEPVKTPDIAEEDKLETHSELCSPAQLRQQTEEVCAAIDKVLQEPLPMHHHDLGQVSSQSLDVPKMPMTLSKVTGRETRYAVLCPPVPATTEGQWTKPGVIRPVPVKAKIILKKEEGCRPNPFKKYAEGTSGREMQHLLHSTSRANKSDLRQHDRNGKTSKGACQKNEQTPYSGQLLLIREDLENTAAKHSKGKK